MKEIDWLDSEQHVKSLQEIEASKERAAERAKITHAKPLAVRIKELVVMAQQLKEGGK